MKKKTNCENGGKVKSYDSVTGQIGFSFLGSDKCTLYFDKIIDNEPPTISEINVSSNTITTTLNDNIKLLSYGISTSNTTEPNEWIDIPTTPYTLTTTIVGDVTKYLWVKDVSGNKKVSNAIKIGKKGWETILLNNGGKDAIEVKGTPNFITLATTNDGMFAAEDDLGTSYYFRGAVDNNWVKFGKDSSNKDMYWRVIRINGDGSIRMIYTGTTAPTESTKVVMTGEGTQIGKNSFNSNTDIYSEYVGYKYTIGEQHGTGIDSNIKTEIDNWYKTTTLWTNENTKKLIADEIYCNDRDVPNGVTWTSQPSFDEMYYMPYNRVATNKEPSLNCTTANDKFTVGSSKGNAKLSYPVGLITADEVALAGGKTDTTNNTSYYLYTNSEYWTGSPGYASIIFRKILGYTISSTGYLNNSYLSVISGIRPVINLSSEVKLSGDGTYNNIYTVS